MALSESQAPVATLPIAPETEGAPADRRAEHVSRHPLARREAALVLLLMLVLAFAWFWHTWAAPTTHTVGAGTDSYPMMWTLAWFPYALGHGLNPLVTHYVNAPHGINLMWNPYMPLLSLLVSPITVIAGPLVAYNVIATAAPALAGWAAYVAFRRWTAPVPALAGALVFGFSSFMAAESSTHAFITFLVSAPLLLIVLDRLLVVQSAPAWRDGALLGLLVWAQLLFNEETLVIEATIAATAVTVAALLNLRAIRSRLRHSAQGLLVAAGVAGALGAYPLAVQLLGPYRPQTAAISPGAFSADLWNFVSPTYTTAVHTSSAFALDQHFTVNWTEWGSYLGIPLIVSLIGCLFICRRQRVAWVAATIAVSAGVLSLGPSLQIAGHNTGIPLPWSLFAHLPYIYDLEPVRAAAPMFLGAGLLLALGLHELRHLAFPLRGGGYGLAAFGLAVLAPMAPYITNTVPTDASLVAGRACPDRPGGTVFILPSSEEYAALWQAQGGFCFALPTYYGFHGVYTGPTRFGLHNGPHDQPATALDLASWAATLGEPLPALTPSLRARAARELVQLKLDEVVLGPTPLPANPEAHARLLAWVTDLLGSPPKARGDLLVWSHPQVRSAP
ncbi:MAG: hypothetical protein J2O38_04660 [Acidimicrobiales bacterium]|nr:hypothetical protein [Acidimicrobiales bacterium]